MDNQVKTNEQLDAKVLALFKKVSEKKAEIEKVQRPRWTTSCTIGMDDTINMRLNIQHISAEKVIGLYAFIDRCEKEWENACKELGIAIPFWWQGYSAAQWKEDFKARILQINVNEKKSELKKMEEKLNTLVSPDQRRQMEVEELDRLLGE